MHLPTIEMPEVASQAQSGEATCSGIPRMEFGAADFPGLRALEAARDLFLRRALVRVSREERCLSSQFFPRCCQKILPVTMYPPFCPLGN